VVGNLKSDSGFAVLGQRATPLTFNGSRVSKVALFNSWNVDDNCRIQSGTQYLGGDRRMQLTLLPLFRHRYKAHITTRPAYKQKP